MQTDWSREREWTARNMVSNKEEKLANQKSAYVPALGYLFKQYGEPQT